MPLVIANRVLLENRLKKKKTIHHNTKIDELGELWNIFFSTSQNILMMFKFIMSPFLKPLHPRGKTLQSQEYIIERIYVFPGTGS